MKTKVVNPLGINYAIMAWLSDIKCGVISYPDNQVQKIKNIATFFCSHLVINPTEEDLSNDCLIEPNNSIPSLKYLDGRIYIPESLISKEMNVIYKLVDTNT